MVMLRSLTGIRAGDVQDFAPEAAVAALRNGIAEVPSEHPLPPQIREALAVQPPESIDAAPTPQAAAGTKKSGRARRR